MALAFCGVHAVPVVGPALSTIGSFTTPATLLIVGSSLANLPAAKLMGTPRLWIACLVRMVAIPLFIFAVMRPLAGGALLGVVVVLAAMPAAPSLMVRGVLYTALTRARELLIVVGDDAAIRAMAANDRQQRRYSGLRWRLAHFADPAER